MKKTKTMHLLFQGLIACLFILIVFTPACSSDSEDDVTPDCNLEDVSYSATIAPIMAAHCNSCHSGASASAGIITATYQGLQAVALSGRLVGSVNHEPGFSRMPQGQPQLGQCPRDQIGAWVNAGAPEN